MGEVVISDPLLAEGLARISEEIDGAFDALLPVPDDQRARLVEAMRYAAIGGGKRLRPLLLTAVAEMFGVVREAAIRAAIAIESIHVYSLIHDDLPCMDDDALRHGKPTVHLAYDEATAVLAGDSLLAFAFEVLGDPAVSADPFTRIELVQALAHASGALGMAGGQMMDIVAENSEFDLQTITRLQQLKTGALLGAAVEMGAILGRIPPEGRTHLRGYARDIGLAFQIADDLIDHEGDVVLAGKAVGKDAAAGKQTFVSLLGAERAREQARMLVEQAIGHLAQHGKEADLLRAVARYIVERKH
ncbi:MULTISPECIES: polyprenyl synthetase family protein [Sphingomonadaceae]|uniref:polyprenyl synthetase family protein n=1 Tax=Sphingomonadaceae TaxID=41297 RepID=UPI00115864C8|nr:MULTISPECIES: farnesyl diphosphate synthase [Sphingomonadaceae]QDK32417.1 farnesyl-diphosphate synthase [Sphingomonas sp. IC081]QSR18674.1 farnesyl-diphosphate synthase [Novosphingobium sp. KA1]